MNSHMPALAALLGVATFIQAPSAHAQDRRAQIHYEMVVLEASPPQWEGAQIQWLRDSSSPSQDVGAECVRTSQIHANVKVANPAPLPEPEARIGTVQSGDLQTLLRMFRDGSDFDIWGTPSLSSLVDERSEIRIGRELPVPVPQSLPLLSSDKGNRGYRIQLVASSAGDGALRLEVGGNITDDVGASNTFHGCVVLLSRELVVVELRRNAQDGNGRTPMLFIQPALLGR
jgi:hypothetical protein